MDKPGILAASMVGEADVRTARLGQRFGRLDLASQLALLAVETMGVNFDAMPHERTGICLAAAAGSLSTDVAFWNGRDAVGGPSPTLFAYTLPSAAIGEIAIHYRLRGPNLCFVGESGGAMDAAEELIDQGEAEGCVCVFVNVVSPAAAALTGLTPVARACALFLQRGAGGQQSGRDMESVCAIVCARKSGSKTIHACGS